MSGPSEVVLMHCQDNIVDTNELMTFLAAIAALLVTMSVGRSVGRSVGLSVCPQRVSKFNSLYAYHTICRLQCIECNL
jgi:hypothetical protein